MLALTAPAANLAPVTAASFILLVTTFPAAIKFCVNVPFDIIVLALIAPSATCCGLIESLAIFTAVIAPDAILVFAETAPVANLTAVTAPLFNLLVTTFPDAILALVTDNAANFAVVTAPSLIVLVTILPEAIACCVIIPDANDVFAAIAPAATSVTLTAPVAISAAPTAPSIMFVFATALFAIPSALILD